jgi:hypothetical protein
MQQTAFLVDDQGWDRQEMDAIAEEKGSKERFTISLRTSRS